MKWNLNNKDFICNWVELAQKCNISLEDLNRLWNEGSIFVFDSLDAICQYYDECELDVPSTDLLKEDIKEGNVIFTQHKFFVLP